MCHRGGKKPKAEPVTRTCIMVTHSTCLTPPSQMPPSPRQDIPRAQTAIHSRLRSFFSRYLALPWCLRTLSQTSTGARSSGSTRLSAMLARNRHKEGGGPRLEWRGWVWGGSDLVKLWYSGRGCEHANVSAVVSFLRRPHPIHRIVHANLIVLSDPTLFGRADRQSSASSVFGWPPPCFFFFFFFFFF